MYDKTLARQDMIRKTHWLTENEKFKLVNREWKSLISQQKIGNFSFVNRELRDVIGQYALVSK